MTDLIQKLIETIEPTICRSRYMGRIKHYPASVILKNGEVLDCIYFVNKNKYENLCSLPKYDFHRIVDIKEIIDVKKSPFRLPVNFAFKVYDTTCEIPHGPFCGFTIEMDDYKGFSYPGGGYAIDFIDLPEGYKMKNIYHVNYMNDCTLLDPKERERKKYSGCIVDDDRLKWTDEDNRVFHC